MEKIIAAKREMAAQFQAAICFKTIDVCYLQFLQVQLSPQLQFWQVQFGLLHFCASF
jgi:hypothetical protein